MEGDDVRCEGELRGELYKKGYNLKEIRRCDFRVCMLAGA